VHELLEALKGGDPGASEDAAAAAVADPPLIAVLLDGMRAGDPLLRSRAGAAAEQAARERPELVAPHADALVEIADRAEEPELRRCAAQMLARTELSDERAGEATRVLLAYLDDADPDVQAWALSAIVAIANDHPAQRPQARKLVDERVESGAAALQERARLLLGQADSWPS
jgi:hypothetical protein